MWVGGDTHESLEPWRQLPGAVFALFSVTCPHGATNLRACEAPPGWVVVDLGEET